MNQGPTCPLVSKSLICEDLLKPLRPENLRLLPQVRAVVQVPHTDEQISTLADWVAVGIAVEAWRQRVFAESAANEQRRLRVEAQ
jgi:hypothetical protein